MTRGRAALGWSWPRTGCHTAPHSGTDSGIRPLEFRNWPYDVRISIGRPSTQTGHTNFFIAAVQEAIIAVIVLPESHKLLLVSLNGKKLASQMSHRLTTPMWVPV